MKCFYHEDKDAVATCQNCGKGLCRECTTKYTPCMCDNCIKLLEENKKIETIRKKQEALIDTKSEMISAIFKGVITVIISIILFNLMETQKFETWELLFFFFPFGWALLTYIEQYIPTIFVCSGILYIVIITFKIIFAVFLGIPCFIYQVIKFMVNINKQKR